MSLRLSLIKTPEGIAPSRTNHIFSHSGGTLGRAETNTWVLPDPDKFLSSCHCEITFVDNQFFILDRSTNGTFINGASEPIGRGSKASLTDGDIIDLGEYRFTVALEANQASAGFGALSPFGTSSADSLASSFDKQIPTDPFGDFASSAATPFFDQQNDPLALWGKPTQAQSPGSPFDIPASTGGFADGFGGAGHPPIQPTAKGSEESDPFANSKSLDDFIGAAPVEAPPATFGSVDLSPGLDQAMQWPQATQESLIPEDWEDDLLAPAAAKKSRLAERPREEQAPLINPIAKAPAELVQKISDPQPQPNQGFKERVPLAERLAALEAMQNMRAPAQNTVALAAEPTRKPAVEQTTATPPPQEPAAAIKSSRLVTALGLDASRLSAADIAEIEELSGKLLREIVDGMLGVLRSRASIKNEFRMNVTTIQPVENNPLKFSVNVDDALENLFLKKSNAFKRPAQAFREGFQEIAEHQLAMIAGIRAGFDSMMDRFNPEPLETSFSKQTKGGLLPGMQKAKYWSCYQEYYQGLSDNMDHSFQQLFGSEFVSAYEDQLRRLVASRQKDNIHEN